MSYYDDDFAKLCKRATPEEKLAIPGSEMVRRISVLEGYAELLKYHIRTRSNSPDQVSIEWLDWLDKIILAAGGLHELREILIDRRE